MAMRHFLDIGLRQRRKNQYSPPVDFEIRKFEQAFNFELPDDYIRFLQFMNGGGRPKLNGYIDPASGGIEGIDEFYGLGSKEADDAKARNAPTTWDSGNLWGETRILRDVFGIRGVPIASDGGGNLIFLDIDHSSCISRLIIATRQTYQVAVTFSGFIDMLISPPSSDATKSHEIRVSSKPIIPRRSVD